MFGGLKAVFSAAVKGDLFSKQQPYFNFPTESYTDLSVEAIQRFLMELKSINVDNLYLSPAIPEEKANSAIREYFPNIKSNDIICLIECTPLIVDDSLSLGEGVMLITSCGIYQGSESNSKSIPLSKIKVASCMYQEVTETGSRNYYLCINDFIFSSIYSEDDFQLMSRLAEAINKTIVSP